MLAGMAVRDVIRATRWESMGIPEARRCLATLGWDVSEGPAGVRVRLGAGAGDLAVIVAHGVEGLATLETIVAMHSGTEAVVGPSWGSGVGVRSTIVRQGPRPVSSCEIGEGLALLAHGEVYVPPAIIAGTQSRWKPGRSPDELEPGVLPMWVGGAAAALRERARRALAENSDWHAALYRTKAGSIRNTFANVCSILRNAPEFQTLRYNEMTVSPELDGGTITDAQLGAAREGIENRYGFSPSADAMASGFTTVASERAYHPVREYLEALRWDGRARLDRVAVDILGAEDTTFHTACVRKWFISAVARALRPGCKVDTCMVLVGPQGVGKSTFFRILGGKWFADTSVDLESKDAMLQINHAWIYELGELDHVTSRAHAGRIKAFITSQIDKYRPPYARAVVGVPRCNVIVGSTNEDAFLADPTGSRRFWCIRVPGAVNQDALERDRDQLWAEALEAYRASQPWWLSAEDEAEQRTHAEAFTMLDPWEPTVLAWVASADGAVTTTRILTAALSIEIGRVTQKDSQRVGAIMRRAGFTNPVARLLGTTQRVWREAVTALEPFDV